MRADAAVDIVVIAYNSSGGGGTFFALDYVLGLYRSGVSVIPRSSDVSAGRRGSDAVISALLFLLLQLTEKIKARLVGGVPFGLSGSVGCDLIRERV